MKKIKLSPAQLNVLFQMKKGAVLHFMDGLNAYWFLSTEQGTLNPRTVVKLITLEFIKMSNDFHSKGILTDKGKTYLEKIK